MQPHYQQPGPGATVAMQYPVTAVQGQGRPYSGGCVGKTLKVTGILHIVGAGLCIVLGIVAICLQAYMSYNAVPLWGSILIFIPTGVVGTVYYCKPKNKCIVMTYLVLTIVSASFAGIMWVTYIIFAVNDDFLYEDCLPFTYMYLSYCHESLEARIAMDALLAVVYFLELACGVTAASASCFKLCQCCRKCCQCCCSDDSPQSGASYHAVSGGAAPGMTLQAYPPARPIYVAGGGSSVPAAQSAGMMYLSPGPQQGYVAVHPTGPPPHAMHQSGPSPNVHAGPVPATGTYTNMQAQGFYAQQPQAFQQSQVQVQQPVQPQVQLQPQVQQQVPQLPQEKPQQEEKEEGDHCLDTSTEEAAGQVTNGPYTDQTALI